jgi:hypothetical protein
VERFAEFADVVGRALGDRRTPKGSAYWYREVVRTDSVAFAGATVPAP